MPTRYCSPHIGEGELSKALEFWVSGRGGEKSRIVFVPAGWGDDHIESELEDWRSQYFQSSELVHYGYNDEANFGSRK